VVEVAEIIVHEADEPNVLAHLLDQLKSSHKDAHTRKVHVHVKLAKKKSGRVRGSHGCRLSRVRGRKPLKAIA
jgi:hypothetical protein